MALNYSDYPRRQWGTKLNESIIDLIRRIAISQGVPISRWVEDRILYSITDDEFEQALGSADHARLEELGATNVGSIGPDIDVDEVTSALDELKDDA